MATLQTHVVSVRQTGRGIFRVHCNKLSNIERIRKSDTISRNQRRVVIRRKMQQNNKYPKHVGRPSKLTGSVWKKD